MLMLGCTNVRAGKKRAREGVDIVNELALTVECLMTFIDILLLLLFNHYCLHLVTDVCFELLIFYPITDV